MNNLMTALCATLTSRSAKEEGAIGAIVIGVVIGALLVIFGIIKFLIPGD